MAKVKQASINLEKHQEVLFKLIKQRTGIPFSELYRRSLDFYLVSMIDQFEQSGIQVPKPVVALAEHPDALLVHLPELSKSSKTKRRRS